MTPEEIEAKLAANEAALVALQTRLDALSKRVDGIGDYAGATHFLATQTKLSTDRRLSHLENDEAENK